MTIIINRTAAHWNQPVWGTVFSWSQTAVLKFDSIFNPCSAGRQMSFKQKQKIIDRNYSFWGIHTVAFPQLCSIHSETSPPWTVSLSPKSTSFVTGLRQIAPKQSTGKIWSSKVDSITRIWSSYFLFTKKSHPWATLGAAGKWCKKKSDWASSIFYVHPWWRAGPPPVDTP